MALSEMESVSQGFLKSDRHLDDLEAGPPGEMLYPGIGMSENAMRWGFIQKVYGIISAQLVITAVVGSIFALTPSAQAFAMNSVVFSYFALFGPFAALIPLYIYRQSHPLNLGLLALFTATLSITVGLVCSTFNGILVVEAIALTAAVVISLTAYTFYAMRKGYEFGYLGPMLFSSLMVLITWGFIQLFFNPGPVGQFLYSLAGALIFSLFIVYDTHTLIKRYSYDEYIWASVNLYLDIINLFLRILRILKDLQGGN